MSRLLRPEDVSGVIVTRGDVDLAPILDTLPYGEVIVWDNSKRPDLKVFGRYEAAKEAKNQVVYFQDDDILFRDHDRLLAAYEPGKIISNMNPEWVHDCGYHDLAMVGAGSLVDKNLPFKAFDRYLEVHPYDELFEYECDFISGVLSRFKRVDLGFEILPVASADNRMWRQEWQMTMKWAAIRRARDLRRVCVSMIVKNEADNIRRCIESAQGYYDWLAVVDTGSTDGTQDIIREVEPNALLEEHEWVDFPTNRNQSLALAESTGADYILILDADDELVEKPDHGTWGELAADTYMIHYAGEFDIAQHRLIRAGMGWKWEDEAHNRLVLEDTDIVEDHKYRPMIKHHGWTRHGKTRSAENLVKMREMFDKQPTPRLLFHIARAAEHINNDEAAAKLYKMRAGISMVEEDEEQFYAQYRLGQVLMGKSFNDGAEALLEAWRMRPWRNEPLRALAKHCENVADRTPYPTGDTLFIERSGYTQ